MTQAENQVAPAHPSKVPVRRDAPPVMFLYENYKGEKDIRHVIPLRIEYGHYSWHKGKINTRTKGGMKSWFLVAWDLDRKAERCFTLGKIKNFCINDTPECAVKYCNAYPDVTDSATTESEDE
jgi:hypothetical protein